MTEIDRIKARIRAIIAQGRMSKRELARRAGIQSGALTGMEADDWNPKAATLDALLRAIRTRPLPKGESRCSAA